MWQWLRTLVSRPRNAPSFRAVVAPTGDPYREDVARALAERTVEPCTLEQVYGALRDAGLPFKSHRRGFDLLSSPRSRVMSVRIGEPTRIEPTELECSRDAPELLLDLALAIVPLFGPLLVDVPFAGTLFVDGSKDRRVLGEEAAQRIQQIGRRVAARAPISFPILVDLARRMRQPR